MEQDITSLQRTARQAGLLNLLWILSGLYAMIYLSSKINTQGDTAITAQNIITHAFLFRTGIVNGLISGCVWILLVFHFYRMFRPVHEQLAKLLVAFVIIQIPAGLLIDSFYLTALNILEGNLLQAFDLIQRHEFAMVLLRLSDNLVVVLEIFWGLWLIPLGMLVYKSRFLPRFLGIWLGINGMAYVVLCFITILLPHYKDITFKIIFPAMLGEVAFMFWLLVRGIKYKAEE